MNMIKENLLPGTGGDSFFAGVWRGVRVEGVCLGGSGWEGHGGMDGGMGGEIVRDIETDGASRFWETVPKAGRFFCAIVEL